MTRAAHDGFSVTVRRKADPALTKDACVIEVRDRTGRLVLMREGFNTRLHDDSGRDVDNDGSPDIIIGSWCGKKFVPAKVTARPGFSDIPAVGGGWLREIKSTLILQPGPAALTDGLDQLAGIISDWAKGAPPRVGNAQPVVL